MTRPQPERRFRHPRWVTPGAVHRHPSRQPKGSTRATLGWTLLLAALLLNPYSVVLIDGREPDTFAAAGNICTVLADLLLLVSALVLSFDARLSHNVPQALIRARMATAATLIAVQDLPLTVVSVADPAHSGHGYRLTASGILTLALVLAVLSSGVRGARPPRMNPLLAGLLLGLVALGARLTMLVVDASPFLSVHRPVDLVILGIIAMLAAAICVTLWRSPLPHAASTGISAGFVMLFAGRLWTTVIEASAPPPGAVVGVVLCGALLTTTVITLLLGSLNATDVREETLIHRAVEAEATVQHDLEIVHEVRATTAGIVAGVHLLTTDTVPPGPRRVALKNMVDAEAARLVRTMAEAPQGLLTEVAVDEVIEPLVVAQETLGHRVTWQPGGLLVLARHDALSEVLNVLLNNAHLHAQGHAATVTSRTIGPDVEIRVSDHGPGIEPELRDRLFQWGARSPSSTGKGIGLQRAHRLMLELAGSLSLDNASRGATGASFVCTLHSAVTLTPHEHAGAPLAAGPEPDRLDLAHRVAAWQPADEPPRGRAG